MTWTIHHGDCLDVLRQMPDNSAHAIVTDPPYGLGFMGAKWDALPPGLDWAEECLRVLKPGGHLLSFGGTRTWHRIAVALEDAGFEIRDSIAWIYSTGMPKSLDVSKAIDKAGGDPLAFRRFAHAYASALKESGLTHSDIDRHLGVKSSSCYWVRTDHRGGMPPRHHWEQVKELLGLDAELERLYDEAERKIVGVRSVPKGHGFAGKAYGGDSSTREYADTEASSPEAIRWEGWGTGLKPRHEPIVVARKPFAETIAINVVQHGTGAINIDASKVGDKWPANVILDEAQAEALEAGGAERRAFYVPKPSKAERVEVGGTIHPTTKPLTLMRYLVRMVTPPGGTVLEPFAGSGTTVEAAMLEGFDCIGIEREAEYLPLIHERIRRATEQLATEDPEQGSFSFEETA